MNASRFRSEPYPRLNGHSKMRVIITGSASPQTPPSPSCICSYSMSRQENHSFFSKAFDKRQILGKTPGKTDAKSTRSTRGRQRQRPETVRRKACRARGYQYSRVIKQGAPRFCGLDPVPKDALRRLNKALNRRRRGMAIGRYKSFQRPKGLVLRKPPDLGCSCYLLTSAEGTLRELQAPTFRLFRL